MPTRILRKTTAKSFKPGSEFRPADPGRPAQEARDAYCTTKQVEVEVDGEEEFIPKSNENRLDNLPSSASVSPFYEAPYTSTGLKTVPVLVGWIVTYKEKVTREKEVCFEAQEAKPAIPPTPAREESKGQWNTRQNFGWDAGARSKERITGDVITQFRVGQDTGVAVGLSRVQRSGHFRDIDFCMRFTRGTLDIFESGEKVVGGFSYNNDTDLFKIARKNGTVFYFKNGEVVHTSTRNSTGSMIVVSSLYGGGDEVI